MEETNKLIAIDFETATQKDRFPCQIGITIIENNEIKETFTRLIQPPFNRYDDINVRIHGIKPYDTARSPEFPDVWKEIEHLFSPGTKIIAHNYSFEKSVLNNAMRYYNMDRYFDDDDFICTYKMYGLSLAKLCESFNIALDNHHDAGFDSRCAAQFYLNRLNNIEPDRSLITEKRKPDYTIPKYQEKIPSDALKKNLAIANPDSPFYDKKVVITGAFDKVNRVQLAYRLQALGADVDTSISRRTHIVCLGDEYGPKKFRQIEMYQSLGYEVICLNENAIMEIISGKNWPEYKSLFDAAAEKKKQLIKNSDIKEQELNYTGSDNISVMNSLNDVYDLHFTTEDDEIESILPEEPETEVNRSYGAVEVQTENVNAEKEQVEKPERTTAQKVMTVVVFVVLFASNLIYVYALYLIIYLGARLIKKIFNADWKENEWTYKRKHLYFVFGVFAFPFVIFYVIVKYIQNFIADILGY